MMKSLNDLLWDEKEMIKFLEEDNHPEQTSGRGGGAHLETSCGRNYGPIPDPYLYSCGRTCN